MSFTNTFIFLLTYSRDRIWIGTQWWINIQNQYSATMIQVKHLPLPLWFGMSNIPSYIEIEITTLQKQGVYSTERILTPLNVVKQQHSLTLQWRHNGRDSVSNHQPHDRLLNRLFRHRWKKTSKLRVTVLCAENSPGTGEFPAQKASNADCVSIWWRHHEYCPQGSHCQLGPLCDNTFIIYQVLSTFAGKDLFY